tara:strand:- start:236 stop:844 length:609 start_codon:yes stop_codon:yes gene_type:complete
MNFTRIDKKGIIKTQIQEIKKNNNQIQKVKIIKPRPLVKNQEKNVQIIVPNKEEMTWGRATWFLFHSLAEKIKDEYFLQLKNQLCNHIYRICNGLPCMLCQNHAVEYMKNVNFNNIRTKTDLKKMLFNFHNVVNIQKNYKHFSYSECEEKYKNANLNKVAENFFIHMRVSRNKNDLHHGLYSKQIFDEFNEWLKEHIKYFNV